MRQVSKLKFLNIKNQTKDTVDLYFYGDIVSDSWQSYWYDEDKCPEDIRNFLNDIDSESNLNIYINSGGGSVFAGVTIYNMLKRHKGHKTVYVDGVAGSIASVIALAGDKVIIPSNAFLMVHKPWGYVIGNADEMREYANVLDNIQQSIMTIYQDNLKEGVDFEEIKTMVDAETWLSGTEAANYFNIEVTEANEVVACVTDLFKNYEKVPHQLRNNKPSNISVEAEREQIKNKMLLELELI